MTDTWLSIITVVKDDYTGFARTIESISQQNLAGVEVCVIDSSIDSEAISALLAASPAISHSYEWVNPTGIYPAMNTGVARAKGDYVYFLNAGDVLASADVVEQLHMSVRNASPSWLFGPVRIVSVDGSSVVTPAWDYAKEKSALFSRGLFPPHQGTLVRRELLEELGGFDVSYRIAADYAAFLRLSQIADPLVVDYVIAEFFEGGVSSVKWQESFREFHRARRLILQPIGTAALREHIETRVHFAKVFAYKELILRARR
jgi:glycosyltransferase involved in cell wall biosynthesis